MGTRPTVHLDKPVLLFNTQNTCKMSSLEHADLNERMGFRETRSGFPEEDKKLTNRNTLPGTSAAL